MSLVYQATDGDALTDVLNSFHLKSKVFCVTEMSAPWSLSLPKGNLSHFHVIERGSGWLLLQGRKTPGF